MAWFQFPVNSVRLDIIHLRCKLGEVAELGSL